VVTFFDFGISAAYRLGSAVDLARVRYAPIATKFRSAAKRRDVPLAAVSNRSTAASRAAGRSPHWIKVKNRAHASLTREF
jgi:hypothetical protein